MGSLEYCKKRSSWKESISDSEILSEKIKQLTDLPLSQEG